MGVAVSILAYQYLHSKGKSSDRHPVSFGLAADYESTLVSGHYAVALSALLSNSSFIRFEKKLINFCRVNQEKR